MKSGAKIALGIVAIGIIAAFILPSIMQVVNKPTQVTTSAPAYEPSFVKEGELTITKADGSTTNLDIEIADDAESVAQGLMWRKSMDQDRGMLFLFPRAQRQSFYMKNTHIPLDIIFIGSDNKIVNIAANTTPMSEANIYSTGPAQFVLEVNANYCAQNGIQAGDQIDWKRLPA